MNDHSNFLLIVEDDVGLSELVAEKLEENGFETVCVHTAAEAISWLSQNIPSLMILDYSLPDFTGKQLIAELTRNLESLPPFIVATGQGDERVAVEMMKLGARDYIIKDRNFLEMIPVVILRVDRELHNEARLKKAEQELRQRESYLSAIIENHPGLVCMKNNEGRILMVNNGFASFWGFHEAEEIIGKTALEVLPRGYAEKLLAAETLVIRKKEPVILELPIFNKGQTKWFVSYKSPVLNGGGVPIGTVEISIDITQRKEAEEKLKENEKRLLELNSDKDRFMSILAHDLKSPFNCVIGLSEILMEQVENKNLEGIGKYAKTIMESSLQVMELLSNLMEWSRSQTGRMAFNAESTNLDCFIKEILSLFAEMAFQKNINLSAQVEGQFRIDLDRAMIGTVLRNLITNAIKFTPTGGTVKVSACGNKEGITVKVVDNGIGISKTIQNKLFRIDENYTTPGTNNEQGSGLGLLLCKEFVEKHGGRIWIESEPCRGATFYFSLPFERQCKSL